MLFSFLTSFALAAYVFRTTKDVLAAVLTQLPALSFLVLKSWETSEAIIPVVANVAPEPLLISVVNLFNIFLLRCFFAKTSRDEFMVTVWWGLTSGLGVAVKLTFIPLLAIPLIILSWKNKIIFIVFATASFVAWTLPILSKYHIIGGWISGIVMHKAVVGGGGILMLGKNIKHLISEQGLFTCLFFGALALIFWKLVCQQLNKGVLFLIAIMAGICFQVLAVTQHPGAHYLLPGLGLFSSLLVICYLQGFAHFVLGRRIIVVFILMMVFLGIGQASAYRIKLAGLTRDIMNFQNQVSLNYPQCSTVDYYRSSSLTSALFFGDGWNLAPQLGQELFSLYPHAFYFHIWGERILNFKDRVWSNDLLAQNPCVLFRGDGRWDFSHSPYQLRLVDKGRFESVYLLTGTTEKQGAILFAGAMQYLQAGEYNKSLMCLLQARKFNYQPDSSIDSLIQTLKPYIQR